MVECGAAKLKESAGTVVMGCCGKPVWTLFLQVLVELVSLLSQHWLPAKSAYVIAITPKNRQVSTDKLCRSKDLLIIFATRLTFYDFEAFVLFHFLVADLLLNLKSNSSMT